MQTEQVPNQITEFLRNHNSRISYRDKWMCVSRDGDGETYAVYEHAYGARKTTTLYDGTDLKTALMVLKGDKQ